MTKNQATTVKFVFEKETPGAVRFQEVDDAGKPRKTDFAGSCVGTLYLRKHMLNGSIPKRLEVTITPR